MAPPAKTNRRPNDRPTDYASLQSSQSSGKWYKTAAVCCLLAVAVFMIYGQTVRHEFIVCDDDPYVFGNPYVLQGLTKEGFQWAMTTTHAGNWHPLTWLSHMADVHCYGVHGLDTGRERWKGPEAGGHHLTNVLLHAASAILLFLALKQMTGAFWLSALAAAMFAVHPLRAESVAWVAERKDCLSGLFWMLTLLTYGWYVRSVGRGPIATIVNDATPNRLQDPAEQSTLAWYLTKASLRYLLIIMVFVLGLSAKSMLVTLPCLLILLDFWPLGRWQSAYAALKAKPSDARTPAESWWSGGGEMVWLVVEKIPFFLITAAVCVVIAVGQHGAGAMSMSKDVSLDIRVANAMTSYVTYLWQMIWPVNLAIFYPHPGVMKGVSAWHVMFSGALAAVLLALVTMVVLLLVRRRGYLAVGWLWYLGTLVPVIGFVRVGVQGYADRYTYLPMIGIYVAVVWGVAELAKRNRRLVGPLAVAACLVLGTWTGMAINQASTWQNSVTVFQHAIDVVPKNFFAYNHLGLAYHNRGMIYQNEAKAAYAKGNIERANELTKLSKENFDRAGKNYAMSVEIAPHYDSANGNLGVYYAFRGDIDKAIEQFKKATEVNPYLASFHANLGMAYMNKHQYAEAEKELRAALDIEPRNVVNRINLRNALSRQGKVNEVVEQQLIMVEMAPNDPFLLNDTAWMLATHPDKAVRQGKRAIALAQRAVYITEGRNPSILGTLAAAYAEAGDFDKAVQTARRAANLALLQKKNKLAESIRAKLNLYKAGIPFHEPAPKP